MDNLHKKQRIILSVFKSQPKRKNFEKSIDKQKCLWYNIDCCAHESVRRLHNGREHLQKVITKNVKIFKKNLKNLLTNRFCYDII